MTIFSREHTFHCDGLEATRALGQALGRAAEPGLVVALTGILGAGKTQFVRGVAEGLEIADSRLVSSPTFVLIQGYAARLPIYHFDVYRLPDSDAFGELGPEEYFESDGVSLVEWADRVERWMPADRLEVDIEIESPTVRRVTIRSNGSIARRVYERFQSLRPEFDEHQHQDGHEDQVVDRPK